MDLAQIDVLLDALFHFLLATLVNGLLFCILFYAVFKSVISIEDENENRKWLKYWVFYGISSFICSFLHHGSFVKLCICGVLLLKFNDSIILQFSYDIVLSNVLKYSRGYLFVLLNEFVNVIFLAVKQVHWIVISTITISEDIAKNSLQSFASSREVVLKRDKQIWKSEGEDITNRISYRNSKKSVSEQGSSKSVDQDEPNTSQFLSQSCIPTRIKQTTWVTKSLDEISDDDSGLRRRR